MNSSNWGEHRRRFDRINNIRNLSIDLIVPLLYLIIFSLAVSFFLLFTGTDIYLLTVYIALIAIPFLAISLATLLASEKTLTRI